MAPPCYRLLQEDSTRVMDLRCPSDTNTTFPVEFYEPTERIVRRTTQPESDTTITPRDNLSRTHQS
jgi:hypothetical protein